MKQFTYKFVQLLFNEQRPMRVEKFQIKLYNKWAKTQLKKKVTFAL